MRGWRDSSQLLCKLEDTGLLCLMTHVSLRGEGGARAGAGVTGMAPGHVGGARSGGKGGVAVSATYNRQEEGQCRPLVSRL